MNFQSLIELYTRVFMIDFFRYFLTASLAYLVFWVLFKKRLQHKIIQNKFPTFKNMSREFKYSMSTVLVFSINGLFINLATQNGFTQIYTDFGAYGWGWFLASFAIMLILHDAYFYWAHRLMHHPKIYRQVHLVHHKSTNPSPWAAYSFHPFEAIIESGIFWVFVLCIPVHPLALFSFLFFMISKNVLGHLGIEIFPKWFVKTKLFNWLTTTTHHDMHHKNARSNYGLYFTWWDQWFKTEDEKYIATFEEVASRKRAGNDKKMKG